MAKQKKLPRKLKTLYLRRSMGEDYPPDDLAARDREGEVVIAVRDIWLKLRIPTSIRLRKAQVRRLRDWLSDWLEARE